MSLRVSADRASVKGPQPVTVADCKYRGDEGGADSLSVPNEHSGQCGCRCLALESSGACAGSLAMLFTPCVVQTSNRAATPAGLALAISGHSALSANARMASQVVKRDDVVRVRMVRILTQAAGAGQA